MSEKTCGGTSAREVQKQVTLEVEAEQIPVNFYATYDAQ